MKTFCPELTTPFVNRERELARLEQVRGEERPAIVVVYGRRRIGKTALLERYYADQQILKFEGIEGLPEPEQQRRVLRQLAEYAEEPLVAEIKPENWSDVFACIFRYVKTGQWVVYFEELQWLAAYRTAFASELKYYWDNFFRRNRALTIVLCGSSASFMIGKVLHSKALHNRSMHELPLRELSVEDATELLQPGCSLRDIMDAYLTVGGIPLYLKRLGRGSSPFVALCHEAFRHGGFFAHEWDRVFVSSLADNPMYRQIVEILAQSPNIGREQIARRLKTKPGGRLSELLKDLERCGFVQSYWPLHLSATSKLKRYTLRDSYMRFYAKFILPLRPEIERGAFDDAPAQALDVRLYATWLGYAFEQFCRQHHSRIARALGFDGVRYRSGSYFRRPDAKKDKTQRGFQIDLCFLRDDRVMTVCELKYTRTPVGVETSDSLDQKIDRIALPGKSYRIHKVLISAAGAAQSVGEGPYFDRILGLEDLLHAGS